MFEETMAKIFSNFVKIISPQIQDAQWTFKTRTMKKTTLKHIIIKLLKNNDKEKHLKSSQGWASLVAQWLRICLLMQGTWVRALVWEDPTCRGATGPVSHNY